MNWRRLRKGDGYVATTSDVTAFVNEDRQHDGCYSVTLKLRTPYEDIDEAKQAAEQFAAAIEQAIESEDFQS
ncbi:MAG TPA: hypothetical protein VMJ32_01550 [Pirellulales bacterium]|nr:hypothetical protein [Pirellulales bacterium]